MEENKNIERLFQEKFKNFEAVPPLDSWNAIEKRLQQKKKKKRVIPFWLQYGSIAAGFTVALFIYWNTKSTNPQVIIENKSNVVFEEKSNDNQNNITDVNDNTNKINTTKEEVVSTNKTIDYNNKKNNLVSPKTTNPIVISSTSNKENNADKNGLQKNNSTIYSEKELNTVSTKNKKNAVLVNNINNNNKKETTVLEKSNDTSIETALANNIDKKDKKETTVLEKNTTTNSEIVAMSVNSNKEELTEDNTLINILKSEKEKGLLVDQKSLTKNNFVVANNAKTNKDSTIVATELIATVNPLEQLLKEKEAGKTADEKEKEVMSKWAISSNASPVYFNSSNTNASPIGKEFSSNKKEYTTNLSIGLGLAYIINDKFSIRTGVNSLPFNYDTQNVYYTSSLNTVTDNSINISRNSNSTNLVLKGENVARESLSSDVSNISTSNTASLRQQLNFIEVPFEISYKVLDRKIDIELVGGLSTLFLNQNDVYLVNTSGKEMNIGKANNVNDIHFSSNIGIGFKYNFWKAFNANVQPMFKYQLNTFSQNDGNFKPYLVGIYSGLSYSF
jgi:hypothetical protein